MRGSTTIPGDKLGIDADEVEVDFDYTPGEPASGLSGPPEHADPGSGPEIEALTATLEGAALILTPEQDAKAVEWLFSNYEFDDDDGGPDPDDYRDDDR